MVQIFKKDAKQVLHLCFFCFCINVYLYIRFRIFVAPPLIQALVFTFLQHQHRPVAFADISHIIIRCFSHFKITVFQTCTDEGKVSESFCKPVHHKAPLPFFPHGECCRTFHSHQRAQLFCTYLRKFSLQACAFVHAYIFIGFIL